MDLRNRIFDREMRTLAGIEQGRSEIESGLGKSYRSIRGELGL